MPLHLVGADLEPCVLQDPSQRLVANSFRLSLEVGGTHQ